MNDFWTLELKITQLEERMNRKFLLAYLMIGTNLVATLTLMYKAFK